MPVPPDVENVSAIVLRLNGTPVGWLARERERGMVVVTVVWNAGEAPDVMPAVLTVVVVVAAAVVAELLVADGSCVAGRNVPLAASGERGAGEPTVVDVNGCAGAARGAAAPANGNGLKTLTPVGGVGGALPTMGDGLKVVGEVANGAAAPNKGNGFKMLPPLGVKGVAAPDVGNGVNTLPPLVSRGVEAPENGNGLKALPPVVILVCVAVDVVTVVCCTVTAPAWPGDSRAPMRSRSNTVTVYVCMAIVLILSCAW
jgi:hypothetical protein